MKAGTTLTSLSRLESILTSTWQGFLDDFEVMNDLIGGVQRELRDQISQTSKQRFEEAESSRSRGESTSWGQTWSRTSTSTTSTATSTARLTTSMLQPKSRQPQAISTVVSKRRCLPQLQQCNLTGRTEAKLVSKGKDLENQSVKDQGPGLKKL